MANKIGKLLRHIVALIIYYGHKYQIYLRYKNKYLDYLFL